MIQTDDQVIFLRYEIENLVRLLSEAKSIDELKEKLIGGLSHIVNPKVLIIAEEE